MDLDLCPSACIGPFDVKVGTGSILVGALNRSLPYYVDGRFNFIDVEDVARAHVMALKAPSLQERYILGHHDTSVRSFLTLVAGRYDVPVPRRLPMTLAYPWAWLAEQYHSRRKSRAAIPLEFVEMLRHERQHDSTPARRDLYDYNTPIEQTLDKAYHWYKKYRYIRQ